MKNLILSLLLLLIVVVGCEQPKADNSKFLEQITELEAENVKLKDNMEIVVLSLKGIDFPSQGLKDFFENDQFLELVDVGYSECTKGCAKRSVERRKECEDEKDPRKNEICDSIRRRNRNLCMAECAANNNIFPQ